MRSRKNPVLVTERLRLRPLDGRDFDDYAAMNADPEVTRFRNDGTPWDRDRSWRHLAFLIGHWQILGHGYWAVTCKETDAFLGVVGFAEPEGWPGFELAGALARPWWGRGYATEAAQAALEYAFETMKKDRVISLVRETNHASIRLVERLGETLQGRVDVLGFEMLCFGIDRERHRAGTAKPQAGGRPAGWRSRPAGAQPLQ